MGLANALDGGSKRPFASIVRANVGSQFMAKPDPLQCLCAPVRPGAYHGSVRKTPDYVHLVGWSRQPTVRSRDRLCSVLQPDRSA